MKFLYKFYFVFVLILTTFSCQHKESHVQHPNEPLSLDDLELIDLSHSYSRETVYWVTAKEFKLDTVAYAKTDKGFFYAANNFETAEHGGTHIDAPIHFAEGKQTVDEIPLKRLIGKAVKINVSEKANGNADYLISVEDLIAWETKHKQEIPEESILLLESGHSKFYPNKLDYLGTDERGEEAISKLHFPGLDPEAAEWLINNRKIKSIGIDTPSIDYGQSEYFKTHVILLRENIPVFENLTNLNKLPESGFSLMALPMKIKGGSGAPLRIVALVPNNVLN